MRFVLTSARSHRRHREPAGPQGAAVDQRRAAARRRRTGSRARPNTATRGGTTGRDGSASAAARCVAPPTMGARRHPVIGDAPGRYVRSYGVRRPRQVGGVGLHVAAVHREQGLLLVVAERGVLTDRGFGVDWLVGHSRASSASPTWRSNVSVERSSARPIDCSTRTDGSWSPRSSWLRYGLDTCVRSASWRSERLAS